MKFKSEELVKFQGNPCCNKCRTHQPLMKLVPVKGTDFDSLEMTCAACGYKWKMFAADHPKHGARTYAGIV